MNRKQIETLYIKNKIDDFRLKTQEDLIKTHGIRVEDIPGFKELGAIQQKVFRGFILNFFNGCGLELRATFEPVAADFVRETSYYYVKNDDNYDAGTKKEIILRDGRLILESHRKVDDEELEGREVKEHEPETYLRFRYYESGDQYREEPFVSWLHVYSEESYG